MWRASLFTFCSTNGRPNILRLNFLMWDVKLVPLVCVLVWLAALYLQSMYLRRGHQRSNTTL